MKIVVLAAGTSTEREVSIVSGTNVCKALRSKGHQAILVDVFFGKEGADPATAFDGDYDVDAEAAYISSFNDQVKDAVASGREFFGPGVIELCKAADVVFMALHGANGEDGRVQAYFDLCGIPYTGTGYLSSAMAWNFRLWLRPVVEVPVSVCISQRHRKNTKRHCKVHSPTRMKW